MKDLIRIKARYEYESSTKEETIIEAIQKDFNEYFKNCPATEDIIQRFESQLKHRIQLYRQMKRLNENTPLYKHDCTECLFLGDLLKTSFDEKNGILNVKYFDLYAHTREGSVEFIARYGDKADEYLSFRYFVEGEWEEQKALMKSIDGIYEAFERYGERCRPKMPEWYMKLFPDETCI